MHAILHIVNNRMRTQHREHCGGGALFPLRNNIIYLLSFGDMANILSIEQIFAKVLAYMVERRYENSCKVYVKVEAIFYPSGQIEPVAFWWESGRRYEIDAVIDVCRAASLKAGGIGTRYTILVRNHQTFMWLEEDRWFMERRDPN